jgi:hypothetical protein
LACPLPLQAEQSLQKKHFSSREDLSWSIELSCVNPLPWHRKHRCTRALMPPSPPLEESEEMKSECVNV